MKFCAIIPTREDRPGFLDHCLMQMNRQTVKPVEIFIIGKKYIEPVQRLPDIKQRVMYGIKLAKEHGIDYCYIIEDDDYYPDEYFESMSFNNYDFVGIESTIQHHIVFRKYLNLHHACRSSLYCTGLKISSLEGFNWNAAQPVFLDIDLWDFINTKDKLMIFHKPDKFPIGIKHGIGMCGGVSHNNINVYTEDDNNYDFLKKNVRKESFEFYMKTVNLQKEV